MPGPAPPAPYGHHSPSPQQQTPLITVNHNHNNHHHPNEDAHQQQLVPLKPENDALVVKPKSEKRKKSSFLIFHRQESVLSTTGGQGGGVTSPGSATHSGGIRPSIAPSGLTKASFLVSLRAATLLLPLYGLHYLVIVYRPDFEWVFGRFLVMQEWAGHGQLKVLNSR